MISSILAGLIRMIGGANARWQTEPSRGSQRIYFANHTSHLDAIVLWALLPLDGREITRPVAAREYWEATRLRRYLSTTVFHSILIDRTKVTVENNPIRIMVEAMGTGHSLIIFPEGGRGAGEEIGPFKGGLYHLAKEKPQAELIPVFIDNLNRILPKGEFLPVPLLSCICFGGPLFLETDESKAEFLERARLAILNLRHL